MIDINKYIGIPYKSKGYWFDGADCYGLVYLFLTLEYGVKLPKFKDYDPFQDVKEVAKQMDLNLPLLSGKPTKFPKFGDLVLFKMRGVPSHLGIYAGNNTVLHILKGTDAVCESLNSTRLKGKVEGFYEFERKNKT